MAIGMFTVSPVSSDAGSTQNKYLPKAVTSVIDIGINWAPWLKTDTIATSVWTADAEIVLTLQANTTNTTACFIGGGLQGKLYKITNTITTSAGKVDSRYIGVVIEDTPV